jgi:hypothetical protein
MEAPMEDTRPVCPWKLDANGFSSDTREPPGGCRLPPGLKGWSFTASSVDEHGHVTDEDAHPTWSCGHRDTPEWQAAHRVGQTVARAAPAARKKEKVVPQTQQSAPDAAQAAPVPTTASVGVPAVPSADDLSRIAAQAGGGANGIVMAALAILGGGGAAWKYLQSKQKAAAKRDELAHEQRMKELDLQRERGDDQHKACESARVGLSSRIESLEGQGRLAEQALSALRDRLDAVAAKADGAISMAERTPDLSKTAEKFEETDEALEALSKRLSKVETAVKAKKESK